MIEEVVRAETRELERRERAYRGDRPEMTIEGHEVVLVDDGLATGSTMRAAVQAIRSRHPSRIVIAVPVAPPSTVKALSLEADLVVCPATPFPGPAPAIRDRLPQAHLSGASSCSSLLEGAPGRAGSSACRTGRPTLDSSARHLGE